MNLLHGAIVWLNDPLNWQGPDGVPHRTAEHLYISFTAVFLGAIVALPTAFVLGHTGRGGGFTVAVTNVSRAVPTLALLTIFAATAIGFGNRATILALAVFAIPPLLTNTYVGIRAVDPDVVEAARGMGMSGRSVLFKVELPLAVPLIAAGSGPPRSRWLPPRRSPLWWAAGASASSSTRASVSRTGRRSWRAACWWPRWP